MCEASIILLHRESALSIVIADFPIEQEGTKKNAKWSMTAICDTQKKKEKKLVFRRFVSS